MLKKFKKYQNQILHVIGRFPIVVGLAIYATLCFIALYLLNSFPPIFSDRETLDYNLSLWLTLHPVPAMALAYAVSLWNEQKEKRNISAHLVAQISWILAILLAFQFLPQNTLECILGIGFVLLASPFILPFWKNSNDLPLWKFAGQNIKSATTAILATAALNASVFFLLYAIGELFDVNFEENVFVVSAIICWSTVFPILFLSGIPEIKTGKESERNKFISNVIHFLFIPVFLLYIAFLYAYGVKIICMDADYDMVSLFASIAVIAMLVITTIIYPSHYDSGRRIDRMFLVGMPLLTIPLVIFMSVDLVLALVNDNIDVSISSGIYLNLWYYVIIAITCICVKKKLRLIIVSFCLAVLFAYSSPWNIKTITKKILTTQQDNILNKYGFSSFPADCENYLKLKEAFEARNPSDLYKLTSIQHHLASDFDKKELECNAQKPSEKTEETEINLNASTLVTEPVFIPKERSRAIIYDKKIEDEFLEFKDSVASFQIKPIPEDTVTKISYTIPLDTLENRNNNDGIHNPLILEDSISTFVVHKFDFSYSMYNKYLHLKGILFLK